MNKVSVDAVNALDYDEFVERFGNTIEHCPVMAAAAWERRPFTSARDIHSAIADVIDRSQTDGRIS